MKDLKIEKMKNELILSLTENEFDIPGYFFRNLKNDIANVLKKYSYFDEKNLTLKVKVLKDNKYIFLIDCLADSVLIDNNI